MAESTEIPVAPRATSAPQRLVNLTEREIVLDAQRLTAGGEPGLSTPSVLRLPPEGQFARVDDDRARLGKGSVSTAGDLVRLTRLRRSRRLTDLPEPQPGTWYVVSRLTAHAARHRADLLFPFSEVRDGLGRGAGARGLGVYRRSLAVAERYWDWRARVRGRRSGRSLPADWLTGGLFGFGTALLSAGAGLLPGVLDDAGNSGGQAWATSFTVVFLVIGLAALGVAARRWLVRQRMLGERGTAYIIEETAIHWRHEEKHSVLEAIASGFPSVLRVPGPGELGDDWRWQADASGAPQWDARTDELVRSFWAVYYNDDHVTRNAVFVWAPWAVAMAFAARATARRRGLVLHVRQRPSGGGAAGPRSGLRLEDEPYDFLRARPVPALEAVAPWHALHQAGARLVVMIRPVPGNDAGDAARADRPGGEDRLAPEGTGSPARRQPPRLLLLVVRFVQEEIGPIPADARQARDLILEVAGSLATSVLPAGTYEIPAAEWRLTARDGCPADERHVRWPAFPAAADAIAGWVEEQASAHPGHVILLAARMPQEIAMGLGIQLGQRSSTWPRRVYPVHYAGGRRLVVPDLDLGRESVRPERRPGS